MRVARSSKEKKLGLPAKGDVVGVPKLKIRMSMRVQGGTVGKDCRVAGSRVAPSPASSFFFPRARKGRKGEMA